jgi:hypothetical protein
MTFACTERIHFCGKLVKTSQKGVFVRDRFDLMQLRNWRMSGHFYFDSQSSIRTVSRIQIAVYTACFSSFVSLADVRWNA